MMYSVALVAAGGAIGASLRYLTGLAVTWALDHPTFPMAIITVNILGSFIMGVFVVLAAHKGLTHLSPLIVTGFLGGFTTFSSFSLETVNLIERGAVGQAALYVLLSVGVSILALAGGMLLTRGAVA
ncbi:fluoride efflux transporter CrcB [Pseudodonghicola flavimaris]|uniref:Fluoride-specific ion channel FluC n=1 Tax=Pseudodonghicola flavimaris TaxID=3050036 RepID=A0ABT7F269_9RHOB|nr:fluoride efflux transporter CrcB [Pseudodonghicola flavimaris]MDK3018698.1 fluoride efflux transporter CrcB [Pseudodonghicola flavimaris]